MKTKFLASIIIFASTNFLYSQDTIYTSHYPNGIVTKNLDLTRKALSVNTYYVFNPIENPKLEIKIRGSVINKIKYQKGDVYINPSQEPIRELLMPVDPLTGKIKYSEVVDAKNTKCKDLYKFFKTIPQGEIKYTLAASDETDFSFQKYIGQFNVKYAGDPYTVYFNLLIKFKDEKIKYEYTDFIATFAETRSKGSLNVLDVFSNGVNTTTNEHIKILDRLYSDQGMSDTKLFWKPTLNYISESIATLKKLCLDAESFKKDSW